MKTNAYRLSFFKFIKKMTIIFSMKRILVIGCPGAGKTFFAKKLKEITDLPVVHMDNLYWNKDKTSINQKELEKKLLPYLKEEKWIIDGNYHDTLKLRLKYATDVFFMKMPRDECIAGILERIDQPRDDIPWIETKQDAVELISWTIDYEERTKIAEESLLKEFPDVKIHVFNTREEVNKYLLDAKKRGLY